MASQPPAQLSALDSEPEKNPDSNATTLSFHLEDLKNEDFDSDDSNNTTDCNNLPPRELPQRAATTTVRAKTITPVQESREQLVIGNAFTHTIAALKATESFLFTFEAKTRRLKNPKVYEAALTLKELCHSHASFTVVQAGISPLPSTWACLTQSRRAASITTSARSRNS